ncbi:MAG: hypothetical protein ACI9T7_000591 [Oleiphilaceae bacterium]|jgi:hypothetical protein
MLISFEQYFESESRRLERFKSWYLELNKQDPEQFPLMLNDDKLEFCNAVKNVVVTLLNYHLLKNFK